MAACPPGAADVAAELAGARIDGRTPSAGESLQFLDEWWALARRYVEGWRLYVTECDPGRLASVVVDNNDFDAPVVRTAAPDSERLGP